LPGAKEVLVKDTAFKDFYYLLSICYIPGISLKMHKIFKASIRSWGTQVKHTQSCSVKVPGVM
jgi:hypothetical protein